MAKAPKVVYALALLLLVLILTGCELRRETGDVANPDPMSDLPPTLAPLGAETEMVASDTAASPTVINVQATATQTMLNAGDGVDLQNEPAAAVAGVVSAETIETTEEVYVVTETSAPTAEEAAIEKSAGTETIVVDASESLPAGGPVAANPPTSYDGTYNTPGYGDASYLVKPGDTLFSISQRFGTTVEAIVYANGLSSDIIAIGQTLNIPAGNGGAYPNPTYEQPPAYTQQQPNYSQQQPYEQQPTYQQPQPYVPSAGDAYHFVSPGETLYGVSVMYGTSVEAIAAANGIQHPYILQPGQQLIVPASTANAYGAPPANGYYDQQQQPYQAYPPQQQAPGQEYYAQQDQQGGYYQQNPGYQQNQDYYQQDPNYYQQQDPNYYQQPLPGDGYAQQPGGNMYQQPENYYPAPGNAGTHTIAPGETLYSIAMRYGTSAEALAAGNGLYNPNQIFVGQVLYLP